MNRTKGKSVRFPTEADKKKAVDLLINRLIQAFVIYFWVDDIYPMLKKHPSFEEERKKTVSVKNACVMSTLICVRDLDDFFGTEKSRESDVRAKDFTGYKAGGRFLTKNERDSINCWIAHLTYHPIWTNKTGIAPDKAKNWNTVVLVGRAKDAVCGFLTYYISTLTKEQNTQSQRTYIQRAMGLFAHWHRRMEAIGQGEMRIRSLLAKTDE